MDAPGVVLEPIDAAAAWQPPQFADAKVDESSTLTVLSPQRVDGEWVMGMSSLRAVARWSSETALPPDKSAFWNLGTSGGSVSTEALLGGGPRASAVKLAFTSRGELLGAVLADRIHAGSATPPWRAADLIAAPRLGVDDRPRAGPARIGHARPVAAHAARRRPALRAVARTVAVAGELPDDAARYRRCGRSGEAERLARRETRTGRRARHAGAAGQDSAEQFKDEEIGLTVKEVTYEVRAALRLKADDPGVVVAWVESGAPAGRARINAFELIQSADGEPINSPAEFGEIIAKARSEKKDQVRLVVVDRGCSGSPTSRWASSPDSGWRAWTDILTCADNLIGFPPERLNDRTYSARLRRVSTHYVVDAAQLSASRGTRRDGAELLGTAPCGNDEAGRPGDFTNAVGDYPLDARRT